MKATIVNRDPDKPEDIKEIASLVLDPNDFLNAPANGVPDHSDAIAKAAHDAAVAQKTEDQRTKLRIAKALADDKIKHLKDQFKAETGFDLGYDNLRVYKAKPKIAYNLWKRVVKLFAENPDILKMNVTTLANWLDSTEPNYKVNRDMLYDKLNDLAVHDLIRLLKKLGVKLEPQKPVTIASLRKQFIELKELASGKIVEEFTGRFAIRGSTVYVNGTGYKIQSNSSGKPRIKCGRGWLALDTLREICTR